MIPALVEARPFLKFECLYQTYENASQVASVYSLGKQESMAAVALMHRVPRATKDALTLMVRLSQQLLQTTMEQLKLSIEADMLKLRQWMGRWDVFAGQQGMLGVKYMEDRYLRGKAVCADFMEQKHKLMCFNHLNLGHAAIVSMQSQMGPDGITIIVLDTTFLMNSYEVSLNYAPPEHGGDRFAALYHADQAGEHVNCKETITGLAMSEYWDVSEQAGSKSRGRAVFGESIPSLESLAVVDGEVKTLNSNKIPEMVMQKLNGQPEFLKRILEDMQSLATPEWGTEGPWNFRRKLTSLESLPAVDFELAGMAAVAGKPELFVVITRTNNIWLINRAESDCELSAMEIFGFNTGTYVEDSTLIALADSKQLTTVADLVCKVASDRGVMEVRVVDHTLQPKVQADAAGLQKTLQYRYQVTPSAQVNSFKPKEIAGDDRMNLRPQVLGAVLQGRFTDIQRCSHCGIVWEAGLETLSSS
ncbi:unnamed protein product [Durusdinium trenchii]|uniref:Uncharacterized protein n=1 Tax=Durusdinium trenchii TaxID=1381693 RepID=A0ABP0QYZ9_9DINO